MIRIVADVDIPQVAYFLGDVGDLHLLAGPEIGPEALRDADVLVVRSVTAVDSELLEGSRVRFVATATSGVDHIDLEYLSQRGTGFCHTAGANAESVVEYVVAALFALSVESDQPVTERTVGVVGFGNVGSRLARRLRAAGVQVVVNDPPLTEDVGDFAPGFEVDSLDGLIRRSDVITLHVPLLLEGRHPTLHLLEQRAFDLMGRGTWLVNTSRGDVVSESALVSYMSRSDSGPVVLDVWATEPRPNPAIVAGSRIATPHIAGYGWDARLEAIRRVSEAVRRFAGAPPLTLADDQQIFDLHPPAGRHSKTSWCHDIIRQMYDIEADSSSFRSLLGETDDSASAFRRYRAEYPKRRSFRHYRLDHSVVPPDLRRVTEVLGVRLDAGSQS